MEEVPFVPQCSQKSGDEIREVGRQDSDGVGRCRDRVMYGGDLIFTLMCRMGL